MNWWTNWWTKPPSQVNTPKKMGAKPTRNNPQPNNAPNGKRKRQWR